MAVRTQQIVENMDAISIVVPAYNEEDRMRGSLDAVGAYFEASGRQYEIVVVDDGSTDQTPEIARCFIASHSNTTVISYRQNKGKGYAVRQGMMAASNPLVLMSDADMAAPISELPKLEQAIEEGYDVAVGSRAVPGAILSVRQPVLREWGGRALNLFIQWLAVPGIKDTQCGFKLFRREAARAIFGKCFIDGFGFDIETLYLARKLGFSVKEVGLTWSHQEGSKVRPLLDGVRILAEILRIRRMDYTGHGRP